MKPLVVRCGVPGFRALVWIEGGRGWILSAVTNDAWVPLTDAPGLGGEVLSDGAVRDVVKAHGFPEAK